MENMIFVTLKLHNAILAAIFNQTYPTIGHVRIYFFIQLFLFQCAILKDLWLILSNSILVKLVRLLKQDKEENQKVKHLQNPNKNIQNDFVFTSVVATELKDVDIFCQSANWVYQEDEQHHYY